MGYNRYVSYYGNRPGEIMIPIRAGQERYGSLKEVIKYANTMHCCVTINDILISHITRMLQEAL